VREGGKAKEGKRRGREEEREREFDPPTFQMLPPPMVYNSALPATAVVLHTSRPQKNL